MLHSPVAASRKTYFLWLFQRHLVEKCRDRISEFISGTPPDCFAREAKGLGRELWCSVVEETEKAKRSGLVTRSCSFNPTLGVVYLAVC